MKRGRKLKSLELRIYRNEDGSGYELYVKVDRVWECEEHILRSLKCGGMVNYLEKYLPIRKLS